MRRGPGSLLGSGQRSTLAGERRRRWEGLAWTFLCSQECVRAREKAQSCFQKGRCRGLLAGFQVAPGGELSGFILPAGTIGLSCCQQPGLEETCAGPCLLPTARGSNPFFLGYRLGFFEGGKKVWVCFFFEDEKVSVHGCHF